MKKSYVTSVVGGAERISPGDVLIQLRKQVRSGLIPVINASTNPAYQITHEGELALSPGVIQTLNLPIEVVCGLPVETVHAAFNEAILVYSQPTPKKGDQPSSLRVY